MGGFVALAEIAAANVAASISGDARPGVIVGDQINHFGATRVTSNWQVMIIE